MRIAWSYFHHPVRDLFGIGAEHYQDSDHVIT